MAVGEVRKSGTDLVAGRVAQTMGSFYSRGCPVQAPLRRRFPWVTDELMNVTLSIDEQLVARARKKADALGKSLNQLIRDYLQKLAGGDDPEQNIKEFKKLSGRGHSRGWRFSRNEIHERP